MVKVATLMLLPSWIWKDLGVLERFQSILKHPRALESILKSVNLEVRASQDTSELPKASQSITEHPITPQSITKYLEASQRIFEHPGISQSVQKHLRISLKPLEASQIIPEHL